LIVREAANREQKHAYAIFCYCILRYSTTIIHLLRALICEILQQLVQ